MNSKTNLKNEIKVPLGIWTPNAQVLCYECHGDRFPYSKYNSITEKFEDEILSEEEFKDMKEPKPIKSGYGVTKCIKCRKDIQLREEVAYENSLTEVLKASNINAYMAQTGGMNSAVEIPTKDNGFIWVTYDTCGEDEWLLGVYDEEGDYLDESYMTQDLEELLDYIFKLKIDNRI